MVCPLCGSSDVQRRNMGRKVGGGAAVVVSAKQIQTDLTEQSKITG